MPFPPFTTTYVFCAAVGLIAVAVVLALPLGGWDRVAVVTAVSVGVSLWVTVGTGGGQGERDEERTGAPSDLGRLRDVRVAGASGVTEGRAGPGNGVTDAR